MNNADKERFELVMAEDIPAIFTHLRLDRESIPKGLFCYDIRHDDEGHGIACEIAPSVLVDHWGTIITKTEVPLENGRHYLPDDLNYLGKTMSLEEFMQEDTMQMAAELLHPRMTEIARAPQINM